MKYNEIPNNEFNYNFSKTENVYTQNITKRIKDVMKNMTMFIFGGKR